MTNEEIAEQIARSKEWEDIDYIFDGEDERPVLGVDRYALVRLIAAALDLAEARGRAAERAEGKAAQFVAHLASHIRPNGLGWWIVLDENDIARFRVILSSIGESMLADQMWRLDVTEYRTAQARRLAQRILDRMNELPAYIPDDVRVRYFRAFVRAQARVARRAALAAGRE